MNFATNRTYNLLKSYTINYSCFIVLFEFYYLHVCGSYTAGSANASVLVTCACQGHGHISNMLDICQATIEQNIKRATHDVEVARINLFVCKRNRDDHQNGLALRLRKINSRTSTNEALRKALEAKMLAVKGTIATSKTRWE